MWRTSLPLIRTVLFNNESTKLLMLLGWKRDKMNNGETIDVQDTEAGWASRRTQSELEQPSRMRWASQERFLLQPATRG